MKHWKELNLDFFLIKHDCDQIVIDYPWVRHLRLVLNPKLSRSYGRAWNEGEKYWGTIELSNDILAMHCGHIKEVFIHELCHFIAAHHGDYGHGKIFKQMMFKYTGAKCNTRFHRGIYDVMGNLKPSFS